MAYIVLMRNVLLELIYLNPIGGLVGKVLEPRGDRPFWKNASQGLGFEVL